MIPSFSVDHRAIVPGIFTSRVDEVGSGMVTTYDIRLTRPKMYQLSLLQRQDVLTAVTSNGNSTTLLTMRAML